MNAWVFGTVVAALLAVSGCSPRDSSPGVSAETPSEKASTVAPVTFINRVWIVAESEQVAPGELRVFLAEGTLVMASSHGLPAFGAWNYQDGRLTITEEGLKYDVEILQLTQDVFRIRVHSRGKPVEIRFSPAEQPPLPGHSQLPPGRR